VSSAANTVTPGNEAHGDESGSPRPNPVALEAQVSITGANTASEDGSRHLFSEETTTVLVFKDGAVIRLTAPVSVGQLIFLTNKKSNQEVICQVLRMRSFKAGHNYVELKFTEECADYWGVEFPEEPKDAPQFQAADQAQAHETSAQLGETSIATHSAEDVDKLKGEVQALREQLAAREKNDAREADAPHPAVHEMAAQNASKVKEAALGRAPKPKEELASVNDPVPPPAHTDIPAQPREPENLLMPSAPKDASAAAPRMVSMSLPVWSMEKSPEEQLLEEEAARETSAQAQQVEAKAAEAPVEPPAEELLPKPELDFSQPEKGTSKKRAKTKPPRAPKAGTTSNNVRIVGLAAVLLLAVGAGAWYGKWWQYLPLAKKTPAPAVTPRPVVQRPATVTAKSVNPPSTPPSPISYPPPAKDSTKPASDTTTTAIRDTPAQTSANDSPLPEKRSTREKHSLPKDIAKTQDSPSPAETPSDVPSQAAKLLKSVNPVYPPEAMRSYITGDIKAEVTVLPSGHVADVKVMSGPKALRDAAVDALKQYQYSPATQAGKPVESKTTEVVKFWFNP
jgi:TonB family protein